MKLSELRGQGIADRACGSFADLTLDPPAITNICSTIRSAGILTRNDIARLLNAIASNVVTNWPRTPRGSTTHETTDVCEWLDNAADQIEEGVGLSDWVRK